MAAFVFASTISAAVRVASLDLCADEYLLTLARDDQIVAVSRLSQDAEESPLWRRAKRFPAYGGRAETLLRYRPTILLSVGSPGGRSTQAFARRLGWQSLSLPFPDTPLQVGRNLQAVGKLLGASAQANVWTAKLEHLRRSVPAPTTAFFLTGGGQSVSADGLSARWMRLAGYRQLDVPGGRVTLERLAVHPPGALLISNYRSGQVSLGQRWLDHPLVRKSKSAKIATDGRPWTCGGPLMLDEIDRLRKAR